MVKFSKEKLEYLRTVTKHLNILVSFKLHTLEKNGSSQEELDLAEYAYRFSSYQKTWEKAWKNLAWDTKENESLSDFADSALEQAIASQTMSCENDKSR